LLALGAILLSALLQGIVRRARWPDSAEAAASLRLAVTLLLTLGILVNIAPLIPLAVDTFAIRSIADLMPLVVFLLVSLAIGLAPWIWIRRAWRASANRSSFAFVVGTGVANILVALVLYRGF